MPLTRDPGVTRSSDHSAVGPRGDRSQGSRALWPRRAQASAGRVRRDLLSQPSAGPSGHRRRRGARHDSRNASALHRLRTEDLRSTVTRHRDATAEQVRTRPTPPRSAPPTPVPEPGPAAADRRHCLRTTETVAEEQRPRPVRKPLGRPARESSPAAAPERQHRVAMKLLRPERGARSREPQGAALRAQAPMPPHGRRPVSRSVPGARKGPGASSCAAAR